MGKAEGDSVVVGGVAFVMYSAVMRVLSLCSGIGGLERGIEEAGVRVENALDTLRPYARWSRG
jgi:hypothetical protein